MIPKSFSFFGPIRVKLLKKSRDDEKVLHFFFLREREHKNREPPLHTKPSTRKRCWDCALPSLARARKDTTTTSARLDARAVAEGALSSSSSSFSV